MTLRTFEDECVGCPPELGCLGGVCQYRNVEHIVCDLCGEEAVYRVDDEDLCEDCAKNRILEVFGNFDIYEQANMLDVSLFSLR